VLAADERILDAMDYQGQQRPLIVRTLPALIFAGLGVLTVIYQWAMARPLWLDEEMIALNVRDRAFTSLAGPLWLDQTAPLGWLVLQRVALLMFGTSEWAVRAVPAIFGIAAVACAAWVGYRWLGAIGGAIFVLLCSFGPWISFYAIELKHYSADAFWGLCLPVLTVWASEAAGQQDRRRRLLVWGASAAIGHWFANGALLVFPVCVAVLAVVSVLRRDVGMLIGLVIAGEIAVMSIGIHYQLAIRYARESRYLQDFWAFALPQISAGVVERLSWVWQQLPHLAAKPGGTESGLFLWVLAVAGFVFARPKLLGLIAASAVTWGLALAALGSVPLYERLSLWLLPALYLGIALLADHVIPLAQGHSARYRWGEIAAASVIAVTTSYLSFDIVHRGLSELLGTRSARTNRAMDDRGALAWLMAQRRPGDALITTRFGLPAVWWYGGVEIGAPTEGSRFSDGSPIFVAEHRPRRRQCRGRGLRRNLGESRRVLVYFGFEDFPKGLDDLLLEALSRSGSVTLHHAGPISRAAVVDPGGPPGLKPVWEDSGTEKSLSGCVVLLAGRRW
jgi:hypothetical protein